MLGNGMVRAVGLVALLATAGCQCGTSGGTDALPALDGGDGTDAVVGGGDAGTDAATGADAATGTDAATAGAFAPSVDLSSASGRVTGGSFTLDFELGLWTDQAELSGGGTVLGGGAAVR